MKNKNINDSTVFISDLISGHVNLNNINILFLFIFKKSISFIFVHVTLEIDQTQITLYNLCNVIGDEKLHEQVLIFFELAAK